MRFLRSFVLVQFVLIFAASAAIAKPRKARRARSAASVGTDASPTGKIPPPGYKGTNEGAQGRKNATEDASRAAEGPGSAGLNSF